MLLSLGVPQITGVYNGCHAPPSPAPPHMNRQDEPTSPDGVPTPRSSPKARCPVFTVVCFIADKRHSPTGTVTSANRLITVIFSAVYRYEIKPLSHTLITSTPVAPTDRRQASVTLPGVCLVSAVAFTIDHAIDLSFCYSPHSTRYRGVNVFPGLSVAHGKSTSTSPE